MPAPPATLMPAAPVTEPFWPRQAARLTDPAAAFGFGRNSWRHCVEMFAAGGPARVADALLVRPGLYDTRGMDGYQLAALCDGMGADAFLGWLSNPLR